MIRVLLCDDHDYMRGMVRQFLAEEPDLSVIGETSDIDALLALLRSASPDVIVLDCNLHGHNTVASIPEIVALSPQSQILMFSGEDDPAYSNRALACGARGYLLKDSAEALPDALRQVARGESYLDERIRQPPPRSREGADASSLAAEGHPGSDDKRAAREIVERRPEPHAGSLPANTMGPVWRFGPQAGSLRH